MADRLYIRGYLSHCGNKETGEFHKDLLQLRMADYTMEICGVTMWTEKAGADGGDPKGGDATEVEW